MTLNYSNRPIPNPFSILPYIQFTYRRHDIWRKSRHTERCSEMTLDYMNFITQLSFLQADNRTGDTIIRNIGRYFKMTLNYSI